MQSCAAKQCMIDHVFPPADALEQLNYKTIWYKVVDTKQAVLCYLFAFHMLSFASCLTSAKNF